MKNIIIFIVIMCNLVFSETINYNKMLPRLGNCDIDKNSSEFGKKLFMCDSGFIEFNFKESEIFMNFNGTPENEHERTITVLFNRGWNKQHKQGHKNKAVIILIADEFDEVIFGTEEKWNGKFYDMYSDFKDSVLYKINNENETIDSNTPCPPSWTGPDGECLVGW